MQPYTSYAHDVFCVPFSKASYCSFFLLKKQLFVPACGAIIKTKSVASLRLMRSNMQQALSQ
jgi:hypothetical protein